LRERYKEVLDCLSVIVPVLSGVNDIFLLAFPPGGFLFPQINCDVVATIAVV